MVPGMETVLRIAVKILKPLTLLGLAAMLSGCMSLIVGAKQEDEKLTSYCSSLHEIREIKAAWREDDGSIGICVSGTPARNYIPGYALGYEFRPLYPDAEYLMRVPSSMFSGARPVDQWVGLPVYEIDAVLRPTGCAALANGKQPIEIVRLDIREGSELGGILTDDDRNAEVTRMRGSSPAVFDRFWMKPSAEGYEYEQAYRYVFYRHSEPVFTGERLAAIDARGEGPPGSSGFYWGSMKTLAALWDIATLPFQIFFAPSVLIGVAHRDPPKCVKQES